MSRDAGTPALAVFREVAHHSGLLLRARCAVVIAVVAYPIEWLRANERPVSSGTRLWCDMRAAASNTKPAPPRGVSRRGEGFLGQEAQYSNLRRTRVVPRWS